MINIELKYNAYTRETSFSDGSRECDDFLLAHEGEELNLWIDRFLTNLIDTYNAELSLIFAGIERDCDIVNDAVENYNHNTGAGICWMDCVGQFTDCSNDNNSKK